MKFKNFVSVSENKSNNQIKLSVKKKELRKMGMSTSDLLNMDIKSYVKDIK